MAASPHPSATLLVRLRDDLDDDAFVSRVAWTFLDELPERIAVVVCGAHETSTSDERKAAMLSAHTLRGACALVGASALLASVGEIEHLLRTGVAPTREQVEHLTETAKRTAAELQDAADRLMS